MKNRRQESLRFVFRLVEQFLELDEQESGEHPELSRNETLVLAALTTLIVAIIALVFFWITG